METENRIHPHDLEAEQSLLGSILINDKAIAAATSLVEVGDFYREAHALIYAAMSELHKDGKPIDQVSVATQLEEAGKLTDVGGHQYLAHLTAITPTATHVKHYAETVYSHSIARQLIKAGDDIADIGFGGRADIDAVLNEAESTLYAIRAKERALRNFTHIEKPLDKYLNRDPMSAERGDTIATTYPALDTLLGAGMHKADMIVLAARPSVGKTMLALNLAFNAAKNSNKRVAIFSLEMSIDQVAERMLASCAEVSMQRIRSWTTNASEDRRIAYSVGELSDCEIYVDDTSAQTAEMLVGKARQLQIEQGALDFIIVDYMQLMESGRGGGRYGNRVQEVSEISRQIKAMARDLNVPVLALSQLSRAIEHREDRTPQLSDLRESGSIEQDADIVIFIHREDKYISEKDWNAKYQDKPYPRGVAELKILKHRNGPTGEIQLVARDHIGRFDSAQPAARTARSENRYEAR